jgi:uncharacterized protein (DUF924 family)
MLLDLWFTPERAAEPDRIRNTWFQATAERDAALGDHFRADYDHTAAGVYEPWRDAPQTCMPLIPLLDQLPRAFILLSAAGLRHGPSSVGNRQ